MKPGIREVEKFVSVVRASQLLNFGTSDT